MAENRKQVTGVVRDSAQRGGFLWNVAPEDPLDAYLGQLVSLDHRDLPSCGAILFGLPFDGAVIGRRGAAGGPLSLRSAARRLKACRSDGEELKTRALDLGDIALHADDVAEAHAKAEAAARDAMEMAQRDGAKPRRVIALGGDHSLTFPCAKPYLEKFGERLAVINLDAHLDVRKVEPGAPFNSGTSFGRLLDAGLAGYTVLGARDFQNSPAYVKRVREAKGRIVTAGEIFAKGAAKAATEALAHLSPKCEAIYLSVDIDVADASVVPAVSAPTPGGLLAHQLFELIRAIAADPRTIACDIMELAPSLGVPGSDRSPRLAGACLAELLATAG